jgi:hypothetical protein
MYALRVLIVALIMPTILPDVKYRIQNVDYGTFLERREENLVLRPLKESSVNQEVSGPWGIALQSLTNILYAIVDFCESQPPRWPRDL